MDSHPINPEERDVWEAVRQKRIQEIKEAMDYSLRQVPEIDDPQTALNFISALRRKGKDLRTLEAMTPGDLMWEEMGYEKENPAVPAEASDDEDPHSEAVVNAEEPPALPLSSMTDTELDAAIDAIDRQLEKARLVLRELSWEKYKRETRMEGL